MTCTPATTSVWKVASAPSSANAAKPTSSLALDAGANGVEVAFVPDYLLGDDPPAVRAGLRDAFARLLEEQDFDGLLLAHGDPAPSGGRAQLEAFLRAT